MPPRQRIQHLATLIRRTRTRRPKPPAGAPRSGNPRHPVLQPSRHDPRHISHPDPLIRMHPPRLHTSRRQQRRIHPLRHHRPHPRIRHRRHHPVTPQHPHQRTRRNTIRPTGRHPFPAGPPGKNRRPRRCIRYHSGIPVTGTPHNLPGDTVIPTARHRHIPGRHRNTGSLANTVHPRTFPRTPANPAIAGTMIAATDPVRRTGRRPRRTRSRHHRRTHPRTTGRGTIRDHKRLQTINDLRIMHFAHFRHFGRRMIPLTTGHPPIPPCERSAGRKLPLQSAALLTGQRDLPVHLRLLLGPRDLDTRTAIDQTAVRRLPELRRHRIHGQPVLTAPGPHQTVKRPFISWQRLARRIKRIQHQAVSAMLRQGQMPRITLIIPDIMLVKIHDCGVLRNMRKTGKLHPDAPAATPARRRNTPKNSLPTQADIIDHLRLKLKSDKVCNAISLTGNGQNP